MPNSYLKKLSKTHNIPLADLEKDWERAKEIAKSETDYGLITHIFKKVVNKHRGLHEVKRSITEDFNEIVERLTDIKIKKGRMHQVLGLDPKEKITDKYSSGEDLAQELVNKVGRKSASGMLAYAANLNPATNVFDKALHSLKRDDKK